MHQKYSATAQKLGITIEMGTLARQANGAVTISSGETTVFVSVTAENTLRPDQDFFPLSVDYREKFSAAGRFPGGYFKREGRPTEKEILTSRLCDRPLRPLFPKGFLNEVQVIGLLLSADRENEPDVLMVNGASAALLCSDIPWNGPIGCVRVGEIDGQFVLNPTQDQIYNSTLDLIYVGNEKEMMMIEGSADEVPEARFIEALTFAQEAIQDIIAAQRALAAQVKTTKRSFEYVTADPGLLEKCRKLVGDRLTPLVLDDDKNQRTGATDALKEEVLEAVKAESGDTEDVDPASVLRAFEALEKEIFRTHIIENGKRRGARGPQDLRSITCQTAVLPRVHGSALFQRGDTQTLVTTTLGSTQDFQDMDALTGGAHKKSFILHYNFPPYSVGETGRFGFTSRREIGHGALAERSLLPVLPSEDEFPYAIRVVSEVMESNGSTSMASVCGGCLSLMDAGVPLSAPIAGISIGLVTRCDVQGTIEKQVLLTDIIGAEDHFGDMDFKICGTRKGITGFQLDLKIQGLSFELAKESIHQSRVARLEILDHMAKALPAARKSLNPHAPRIQQIQIDPEKIGALIGPGGKNIKRITESTGAQVDINEDNSGRVKIYTQTEASLQRCIQEIERATAEITVGKIYRGVVKGVKEFGAFVECLPGQEGLVHISELADFRVRQTEDVCKLGDEIVVKCIGIDDRGRVKLSRRAALSEIEGSRKKGHS